MSDRRVLKWTITVDVQAHTIGAGRVVLVACEDDPTSVQVWTDEPTTDSPAHGPGLRHRPARPRRRVLAGRGLVWHVFASPFIDGTAEKAGDL